MGTFKALLRFLYTDDFECVDSLLKSRITEVEFEAAADSSGSSIDAARSTLDPRVAMMQNILAASHKYQVSRLQHWCEQQLCGHISKNKVCSILCQAHLYEAKQLENACLSFIKDNMEMVVATPAFGSFSEEWPEVMLKV